MNRIHPSKIDDYLSAGASIRVFTGSRRSENGRLHIRAVVDDDVIITRKWSYHRKGWIYEAKTRSWFHAFARGGLLYD